MQAARIAPSLGRQLLRLGGGRSVYGQEGLGGSGPGHRARTEPPLPTARDPRHSWGSPGPALPGGPMPEVPLR